MRKSVLILFSLFLTAWGYAQQEKKTNIAVAEFAGRNVSAMDAVTVSDLLRTEIVKTEKYNVLDRANMEQILTEQAFQLTGCTTQECAVRMGKMLNVQKILVGNVIKLGSVYLINVNMIDVESGKIERSEKVEAEALEKLPKTTEYLAEILSVDKTKAEQINRKHAGPEGFNKLGIGLGYPYISFLWNINPSFNSALILSTDLDEVYIYGGRFNYNFAKSRPFSAYAGFEFDMVIFDATDEGTGYIAASYLGGIYEITDRLTFNMDIGPAYVSLLNEYDESVSGIEWIINTGLNFYLF